MSTDLSEIRDALAKATPGPWERVPLDRVSTRPSDCYDVRTLDGEWLCESIDYADANLIANAPAWLAELCDEVERLRAAIERAAEQYGYAVHELDLAEAAVERVRAKAEGWAALFDNALTPEGQTLRDAARDILRALDGAS